MDGRGNLVQHHCPPETKNKDSNLKAEAPDSVDTTKNTSRTQAWKFSFKFCRKHGSRAAGFGRASSGQGRYPHRTSLPVCPNRLTRSAKWVRISDGGPSVYSYEVRSLRLDLLRFEVPRGLGLFIIRILCRGGSVDVKAMT
jgi:hypothetical protein